MTPSWKVCCITCLVVLLGVPLVHAQISPGALSKSHRLLDGPTHCTECHDSAKRPPGFKCLDCHRDIRERLDRKRGLHPTLLASDDEGRNCVKCHSEHNGAEFALVHWDPPIEKFDHRRTGYPLEGKHAPLACRSCHKPEFIPPDQKAAISTKDLSRTYLGLPRSCRACHQDEHHGQFTAACDTCHSPAGWRTDVRFDHQRAKFPLEGAHEKVACVKCHPQVQDAKPYTRFKGVPFQDCTPCHADPHKGSFGMGCTNCHASPATWKPTRVASGFNHSDTKFPLLGKHAGLSCSSCHAHGKFKDPVPFAHCSDCHKKDPHGGQFAGRPDKGDCAACHSEQNFKPSTFGLAEHNSTGFPLRQRHAVLKCDKCHVQTAGRVVYTIRDHACAACHKDIHQGQFQDAALGNRCDRCHNEAGFKPATFTIADHAGTSFPLTGAHLATACLDCHHVAGSDGTMPIPFRFKDQTCPACHADPHQGQFSVRMQAARADGNAAGCTACHTTQSWRDLPGFDHSTTRFPLEGAHRAVLCAKCHKAPDPAAGVRGVLYTSTPRQCSGCHDDVHGGQFAEGAQPAVCTRCHSVATWKLANFDHDSQTTFKLTGAHKSVRCAGCHKSGVLPDGGGGVIYRNTPRKCIDCHGTSMAAWTMGEASRNLP